MDAPPAGAFGARGSSATKVCVKELIKLFNNQSSYDEGNQNRDSGLDNFVILISIDFL